MKKILVVTLASIAINAHASAELDALINTETYVVAHPSPEIIPVHNVNIAADGNKLYRVDSFPSYRLSVVSDSKENMQKYNNVSVPISLELINYDKNDNQYVFKLTFANKVAAYYQDIVNGPGKVDWYNANVTLDGQSSLILKGTFKVMTNKSSMIPPFDPKDQYFSLTKYNQQDDTFMIVPTKPLTLKILIAD